MGYHMSEEDFNSRVKATVRKLLAKVNRVPFLFVGSGLSMRYMGTENWQGLLEWVCESVGAPMKPFYSYMQRARAEQYDEVNTIYPYITTLMERDFADALGNASMVEWAQQHAHELNQGVSAMKIYIADHLSKAKPDHNNDELHLLQKASHHVAGVITTNYDRLMEDYIFPGYQAYVQQEDLLFSQLTGIGEIYKIHGSVENPESLILNERDYQQLAERQQYLLSKILTIFGEYPIIFLGYSMSDQDIRDIINAIAQCAGTQRTREMSERFIFVEYSAEQEIQTAIYGTERQNVEMTKIATSDFGPIYKAIAATNMKYAPKVLRQITQQLYEAAYSGGKAQSIVFSDLENMDELPQDAEIVVGVGVKGYGKSVASEDLYEDILFHNKNLAVNLVVEEYLERYIPQGGVPMYYYLSQYGDGPLGKKTREEIEQRQCFDDYLSKTQKKTRKNWRDTNRLSEWSIESLRLKFGVNAYKHVTLLKFGEIDLTALEQMIKTTARTMLESGQKLDSDIRKDIRIYDFLKYGIPYLNK